MAQVKHLREKNATQDSLYIKLKGIEEQIAAGELGYSYRTITVGRKSFTVIDAFDDGVAKKAAAAISRRAEEVRDRRRKKV